MPLANLHTLTADEYAARRRALLEQLEGARNHPAPYFDTRGLVTIGIGFNINTRGDVRTDVYEAMGLSLSEQRAIDTAMTAPRMAEIRAMPGATQAQRDARDQALQTYLDGVLGQRAFSMTPAEIDTAFSSIVAPHQIAVERLIDNHSLEQLALLSLRFNTPALVGDGLRAALVLADPHEARAEAWYQIRYIHTNQLHKRRYLEAAVFGLYGEGIAADDVGQAQGIYRMYTRYGRQITGSQVDMVGYETSFAAQRTLAQADMDALPGFAGMQVQSLREVLRPAANALVQRYASNLQAIDPLNIRIAVDGAGLQGEDSASRTGSADDLLIGRDNTLADTLSGQGGNDVLVGLSGSDTLIGGTGTDTYVFSTGEGKDTIDDSDGIGQIVVGRKILTGADYAKCSLDGNKQVWEAADGGVSYIYDSRTRNLVIKGTDLGDGQITIANFDLAQSQSNGYVGLRLEQREQIELNVSGSGSGFAQDGHDAARNTVSLSEGLSRGLTCFLNAAAKLGDVIKLRLTGCDASKFSCCNGAETTNFANGEVTLALQEGQTEVSFGFLSTGDIEASLNFSLTATLADAGGTVLASNDMTVDFTATDEASAGPETTRTILGGYPDGTDDLGNHYTGTFDPNRADQLNDSAGNDLVQAGAGDDTVLAHGGGDDCIEGGDGVDALDAGAGNDWVLGGTGRDLMFGGTGDDRLFGENEIAVTDAVAAGAIDAGTGQSGDVLSGNEGNDSLIGTASNDILEGGAGGDVVISGAGDDVIESDGDIRGFVAGQSATITYARTADPDGSAAGAVTVVSGATRYAVVDPGADLIHAGNGTDKVLAGGGDDMVYGEAGDDELFGDAGNDVILGGAANDILSGDNGGSVLAYAQHGSDFLDGGDGNDQMFGNGGSDVLYGGAGDDVLVGDSADENAGEDYLDGEDGNDQLEGGARADNLYGGAGDDVLSGDGSSVAAAQQGDDTLDGEDGNDTLVGGGGADALFGGIGNDQLYGEAADTPAEAQGDDTLDGEEGDDMLDGGGGSDTLIGGAGNDQLFGDDAATAPDKMGNDILDGGAGNDTLVGAGGSDNLLGDTGDDILVGDSDQVDGTNHGNDVLDGGDGNDTLDGGGAADTLIGGVGSDTLLGDGSVDSAYHGNDHLDGGAGDDILLGQGGSDTLLGGDGVDQLDGGEGDDALDGGTGDDLLLAGVGNDTLAGGDGNDQMDGCDGDDALDGGSGDYLLVGGAGNDILLGGDANDQLDGGTGADQLDGGAGDDLYIVDAGSGIKRITDSGGSDTLLIRGATFGQVMLRLGSLLVDTGVPGGEIHLDDFNPDDPTNSGGIETFQFDDGTYTYQQLLTKGITYSATPGDDVIAGTALDDGIDALDGNDVLDGRGGNDEIAGGAGNDVLLGGDGNDSIDGGTGADAMAGGAGDDVFRVDDSGDVVIEAAGEGRDTVIASIDATLADNAEELVLVGDAYVGIGNAGDNLIQGNSDDDNSLFGLDGADTLIGADYSDRLDGGAGADRMLGGGYGDAYVVDNAGDVVQENFDEGSDSVLASVDYVLPANVEELLLQDGSGDISATGNELNNCIAGNDGDNMLRGMAGNDEMSGGGGNDVLEGGTGCDWMAGGAGDDTYFVDNADDFVYEGEGDGADTVISSIDYTLTHDVENLQLAEPAGGGTLGPQQGIGNALDNLIVGNSQGNVLYGMEGNDTLQGGAGGDRLDGGTGADTLAGGAGSDTYVVDDVGDTVVEDDASPDGGVDTVETSVTFTLSNNVENLTLTGTDGIAGTGNALDNVVIGNVGDNALYGMDGADMLIGGAGADMMFGGAGNDTYYFDNVGDRADETIGGGHDWVIATATATLGAGIEDLTLLDAGGAIDGIGNEIDNRIVGNAFDNRLEGGAGNDTLLAGGGTDVLVGGTGNDTYEVGREWGASVAEAANEGIDGVISMRSFALGANVEDVTLLGDFSETPIMYSYGSWADGNELDNRIDGNDANNQLNVADGNDSVDGRAGNDRISGGNGDDALYGGGDAINLTYSAGLTLLASNDDFIDGGAGNDGIDGGSGNDRLLGGAGNDTLYGGDDGLAVAAAGYGDGDLQERQNEMGSWFYGTGFLSNDDNLEGGAGDDMLDGGSGNDHLFGGDGNDVLIGGADGPLNIVNDDYLDGGAGVDSMRGGTGNDVYLVDGQMEYLTAPSPLEICDVGTGEDVLSPATRTLAADTVVENADEGYDVVRSSVSYVLTENLEELDLLGTESIDATGNNINNMLIGNGGNNILDGMGGDDQMDGGAGDDTYVVDSVGDQVTEAAGNGVDTVRTSLDNYALGNTLENLDLTGLAATGSGNALDNRIRGNSTDNVLYGGDGNDIVAGGGGNDSLYGGNGDDAYVFVRGGGRDVISDNSGVDRLVLENVEPADLTFTKHGADLVIGVIGTTDSITLSGWITQSSSVATIAFCSGPVLDRVGIEARLINHAPLPEDDAGQVQEDGTLQATGNVLANDVDPDGNVLSLATPAGVYAGNFGTLTLAADGGYAYVLDNAAPQVQALRDGVSVVDTFSYVVSDDDPSAPLSTSASLSITVAGTNDIPVISIPLPDRTVAANAAISWQVAAGSFTDIDQGDTLSYAATLADGSALPSWLAFDATTQTFGGQVPANAAGSMDIVVTASDGHGALSVASDVFHVVMTAGGGCNEDGEHDDGGEHAHGGHGGTHGDDHGSHQSGHSGCGDGTGHGGNSGATGDHGGQHDEDHGKHSSAGSSSDSSDETWDRARDKARDPSVLDVKRLDQHYADNFGTQPLADTNAYVSQWIQVDLAVSRQLADEGASLSPHKGDGADIAALGHASSGFLGSQSGFGSDTLSLLAGAGTQLRSFKGLQEGMQRIGGR